MKWEVFPNYIQQEPDSDDLSHSAMEETELHVEQISDTDENIEGDQGEYNEACYHVSIARSTVTVQYAFNTFYSILFCC